MHDYDGYLWGPFLYRSLVDDSIINEIYSRAKELPEQSNQPDKLAGVIDNQLFFDMDYSKKIFHMLKSHFDTYMDVYVDQWKPRVREIYDLNSVELELSAECWVNFQRKMEYQPRHIHDGDISFVLYLDVPEEIEYEPYVGRYIKPGRIAFTYGQNVDSLRDSFMGEVVSNVFTPKTGQIFIFPASLAHEVASFKSDVVRVSLSSNVKVLVNTIN